jgi:hypothetical protein
MPRVLTAAVVFAGVVTSAGFGVVAAGTLMLWRRRRAGRRQG